jgi:hypothetical protein
MTKYLYRKAGWAVTLLGVVAGIAFSAQAQMRLSPPERTTPRALAVVETDARGAQRILPIALFYEHRYYDAGLYRASPVPLALVPQTVYEVQQAGKPVGLFTVLHPVHMEGQWVARGKYEAATERSPRKTHDEPIAADPKRPVLHRREGSEGDDELAASGEGGELGATQQAASGANGAAEDPERPHLRYGRGQPALDAKTSEAGDQFSGVAVPREVAISDAGKALPPADLLFHCSPEERETLHRQAQQLARAELKQVATARGIPVDSLGPPSEEDFRAYRLEDGDYATVVYSARFATAKALSAQYSTGWVVAVVARYDGAHDDGRAMTLLYAAISDPRELEHYPEVRPVDLVDAEGQGHYLLLLRETGAGGIRWRLGRLTGYELQTVFATAER